MIAMVAAYIDVINEDHMTLHCPRTPLMPTSSQQPHATTACQHRHTNTDCRLVAVRLSVRPQVVSRRTAEDIASLTCTKLPARLQVAHRAVSGNAPVPLCDHLHAVLDGLPHLGTPAQCWASRCSSTASIKAALHIQQ